MYAILGDIRFEGYKGFADFSATNETVLSEHAVIEGKPRLQKTGEKLEEITLKFLLHSLYTNPEADLETLQTYRREARVVPFVSGSGYNYGDYAVKSISRTLTQTDNDGNIIGIEVEVSLIEVFNPGGKKKPVGERLATKEPNISVAPRLPQLTDPQAISVQLRTINVQTAAMDKDISEAARVTSKVSRTLRKSKERINKVRESLEKIEEVGTQTNNIIAMYDAIKGQTAAVRNATEALAIFVEDGDIHSAVTASSLLRNSFGQLSINAAPINNLVATRRDKENPLLNTGTKFDFKLDGRFS